MGMVKQAEDQGALRQIVQELGTMADSGVRGMFPPPGRPFPVALAAEHTR